MITKEQFKEDYIKKLSNKSAKPLTATTDLDRYNALSSLAREYLTTKWIETNERYNSRNVKQIYYFSIEFLTGRFLSRNLISLDIFDLVRESLNDLGYDLDKIIEIEKDQGLGNGGLGRLAAGFLDSMAALSIPGHGCGIRYKYGLFEQRIVDGYQVEYPDKWLNERNVWEIKKPDRSVEVHFGGNIKTYLEDGKLKFSHENFKVVKAVPYDTPIIGYKNDTVNTLRLWSAETSESDSNYLPVTSNAYDQILAHKHDVESISQVLYPNDSYEEGKKLRLKQEYFFVSAGIQGILKTYEKKNIPIEELDTYIAIHINDTHPALLIPELMRILIDEKGLSWETAWDITNKTMSYTNHTIMSEALEKWEISMFKDLLPRIYMIVEEINRRFVEELRSKNYSEKIISDMVIINNNFIKMAHLAIVGCHSINGVAHLHTEILKNKEFIDFYKFFPRKFNNKTNGISHRRWLLSANPQLSSLITEMTDDSWVENPMNMRKLLQFKDDNSFKLKLDAVKHSNKERLANYIFEETGIKVNPKSIFDIHCKRFHEYKRQTLNILHIMHLYNQLKENPDLDIPCRTFIFAGKSAPNYHIAKQIIKLINSVAYVINNDSKIRGKIKVVFLENYGVSLAEILIPAADISEQISTTTKEASGTGNMKFMMNGAITIATLDGANVEILNEVGKENIVIFGLSEEEVYDYYRNKTYNSYEVYESNPELKKVLDQLTDGTYHSNHEEFKIIKDSLLYTDEFFVLKDFEEYSKAQRKIGDYYRNFDIWLEMSAINIACSGSFSSDKTIMEYSTGIWEVERTLK
jgi:starch phosphorylase